MRRNAAKSEHSGRAVQNRTFGVLHVAPEKRRSARPNRSEQVLRLNDHRIQWLSVMAIASYS